MLSRPVLVSVKEADQGGEVLQTRAISRRDLFDSSYSDYELSPGGLAEQTLADCKVEEDGAVSINGTVACTLTAALSGPSSPTTALPPRKCPRSAW